ncbi:7684_t:CDS:2, partial [Racocetra persica]
RGLEPLHNPILFVPALTMLDLISRATPVFSFVIKDIIDYFIRIKSSDEEIQTKPVDWSTEGNNCVNCGQIIEIEDDTVEIEEIDDYTDDNYDTSDSFIDDDIYTDEIMEVEYDELQ